MDPTSWSSFPTPCKERKESRRRQPCRIGAFVLLATAGLSCAERSVTAVDVVVVDVSPTALSLTVGDSARIQATLRDGIGNVLGGRSIIWVSSDPTTAIVSSDGRVVALNAGLATITAESEGARGQVQVVVAMPPAIGLRADGIEFDFVARGPTPAPVTLDIRNDGGGVLDGLTVTIRYEPGQPTGWLEARLAGTSAPTTMTVATAPDNLPSGTYNAVVEVQSAAARPDRGALPVTLEVRDPPPSIALGATTATFIGIEGDASPADHQIDVANGGGGTLSGLQSAITYAPGDPAGWLTATLSDDTAPAVLTLSAETGALPPGTYGATVQLSASGAANSPLAVQVTFDVQPTPPTTPLHTRPFSERWGWTGWEGTGNDRPTIVSPAAPPVF
jgi:hypothetical protein